jgi:putative transposase
MGGLPVFVDLLIAVLIFVVTRGSFPTDEAATKLIYLAIRSFEKTGRAVREWVAARNQFAILYPERFNK